MDVVKKVEMIQEFLSKEGMDGWLIYDNHGSNRFVRHIFGISPQLMLTRRFFYWIPKHGEPQKILHKIEAEGLDHIPGKKNLYLSWLELEQEIKRIIKKAKCILMEYSPRGENPQVSIVDAGTFELIKGMGVDICSSANLLQRFMSVLDEKQINSHLEAAAVLQKIVNLAWDLIAKRVRKDQHISEYQVQEFILNEFEVHNCMTEEGPICAVNEHSALPHYMATEHNTKEIIEGDFILIDLWCKKKNQEAIYADITRVAVASSQPNPKHQEIFDIVRIAQKKAADFVSLKMKSGGVVKGYEVDDICRSYINACGYGHHFTHRTGHNIDINVHGAGANFDNLETVDCRQLLPGMCFSIEPGIYLSGNFGIRLETNLLIGHDNSVKITGGMEENLKCLL